MFRLALLGLVATVHAHLHEKRVTPLAETSYTTYTTVCAWIINSEGGHDANTE
jgi:hypothetical protein